MDAASSALDEIRKIAGGVELEVTFEDGHTERVKVRQIKIVKEFERYLAVQDDEAKEVELVCDKPEGWAETLTAESFDAIAEKSQELNLPLFQKKYRRLKARSRAMNPELTEKIERDLAAAAEKRAQTALASASPS